jgi:hypothetical protein
MTPNQIIKHFGSPKAAAEALHVTLDNIYRWRERKFVPARRQVVIAGYTDGALKVGPPFDKRAKK